MSSKPLDAVLAGLPRDSQLDLLDGRERRLREQLGRKMKEISSLSLEIHNEARPSMTMFETMLTRTSTLERAVVGGWTIQQELTDTLEQVKKIKESHVK